MIARIVKKPEEVVTKAYIKGYMDGRFDEVDKRFDRVDKRFNELEVRLEKRFDSIDKRFEEMDIRFEKRFERIEARLTNIEVKLEKIMTMLDWIVGAIKKSDDEHTVLVGQYANCEERLDDNDKRILALES